MVVLIAQRSKYDFWIPDELLILETKTQIKTKIFEVENFDRTKKSFFGLKKIRFVCSIEFTTSIFFVFIWVFVSRIKFRQESKLLRTLCDEHITVFF